MVDMEIELDGLELLPEENLTGGGCWFTCYAYTCGINSGEMTLQ